jgi:hypothetical protein
MPDSQRLPAKEAPSHRGRVQAQGGGTEKSVPWAQSTPPTVSDVLRFLDDLEKKLTPAEKRAREEAFRQIREYVSNIHHSGLSAGTKKSFPRRNRGDIRVDLEVQAGVACVGDPPPE